MKIIALFIVLLSMSFASYGQKQLKGKWAVGSTKIIDGTKIKRTGGDNEGTSLTNVSYQNQKQLIDRLKAKKKKGKIKGDAYKKNLAQYKNHASGGLVQLYIVRKKDVDADLKHFSVEILDKDGVSFHTKQMKPKNGKFILNEGIYTNQGFTWMNKELSRPFTVVVHEVNGDHVQDYTFLVQ